MVSPRIEQILKQELARLTEPQQERVVEFARSLAAKPKGMSGEEFFATIERLREVIPPDQAKAIGAIIERDCRQIDSDGW